MIKASDLRILDEEELEDKLRELKETLFNLRFQHATGQLDNPMRIKETRRDLARVCTVITERKYAIHTEAFGGAQYKFEEPEEVVDTEAEEIQELEEEAEERIGVVPEAEEQLEEEIEEELKDL
jgi:large subunit ribosomal protein L29